MNYPDNLFPAHWYFVAHAILFLLAWQVGRRTDWRVLLSPVTLNLWLAACVVLMLLWSVKTGIKPGLDFHMLGATALTLMFGPGLALAAIAVIVAAITLAGQAGWEAYSLNLLVMGALPVVISHALFRAVDRHLPNHFFIYVFLNAFFGAGLAMALTGIVSALLLGWAGAYAFDYLGSQYLPYYILMGWSEALLTGMAITLMAVFRPLWVSTFDDARYLGH